MRFFAVVTLFVIVAMILTGCEVDTRKCLKSHTDLMPITMVGAKGQPYVTWMPVDTCDRYEEKPAQ
ncbi:hypothetical protein ACFYY2_12400 [Streptomyces sp. NPDC001822]|uniref:hypothetical protein n=1 Tax=Streptomyces sp. NPDC001822 TaxID=3364614 RepID=UPI0036977961